MMTVLWHRPTLALAAFATLLTAPALTRPALAAGSAAVQRQDLHGTWRLNEDITARMKESERQEDRPEGRRMEGGGGRRGGPGGPGGPGGLPGGGGDFEEPERLQRKGAAPSLATLGEVRIEQTADKVTITDGHGHQNVLWTDGRKVTDGGTEMRAKWDDDGSLVVRVTPKDGPRRTETWLVSNDRKLLYLTVELEGGTRMASTIRRAYSAATPGEPKPPAAVPSEETRTVPPPR